MGPLCSLARVSLLHSLAISKQDGGGSVRGGTVSWHHLPPDCVSLVLDLFISILVSALPVSANWLFVSACPCLCFTLQHFPLVSFKHFLLSYHLYPSSQFFILWLFYYAPSEFYLVTLWLHVCALGKLNLTKICELFITAPFGHTPSIKQSRG